MKIARIWVDTEFAKNLKREAIERNKSMIKLTRDLAMKKSYIEELTEKLKIRK